MDARSQAGDGGGMRRHYRRYTTEQRSSLLEQVGAGTSVAQAAARLGVKESTAYAWVGSSASPSSLTARRERASPPKGPRSAVSRGPMFARLVQGDECERSATITLRVGTVEIGVRPGFDARLLRAVVVALQGGPA